jgi:sphingosine kinase
MWEVINGIMKRKDWQACLKLPLGIIPAGSGNALGCYLDSLNFFTAAMNIIKGYPRPMDLWRVTQQDFMEWGFVVSAWCMVSDVAMEAESRRWMGSVRFDVGALVSIAKFKKYPGRVSLLPVENWSKEKGVRCDPHFGSCEVCTPKSEEKTYPESAQDMPGPITHTDLDHPPPEWKVIEDEFIWFICGNVTHLKPEMVGFPFAHIGDGTIDIVSCRKGKVDVGRGELLKLFGMFTNGEYVDHPAVEYFKARALILEPRGNEGAFIVDGEPIKYQTVKIESFPGLATVFCQPPTSPK